MNQLNVAIVQLRPKKGPIECNDAQLRAVFAQLAADPPDLIVLPEAALTGYFLEGATFECAVTAERIAEFLASAWSAVSRKTVHIVCGFFHNESGTLYNSAITVTVEGEKYAIDHVHRKVFLPTYGVFDEARFVTRGRRVDAFAMPFGMAAVAICEDMWHGIVPMIAALKGARVLIVPSASPGRGIGGPEIQSVRYWESLLQLVASEHGVFVLYAGLVGFEGGKAMTGASCIVDPFGKLVGRAPSLEPAILRAALDLHDIEVARAALPLQGDLHEVAPDLLADPTLGIVSGLQREKLLYESA